MKLDPTAIRSLGRIAERTGRISRNPQRYEVDPEVLERICDAAGQLEELLVNVETIKIGARTVRENETYNR